ncbi:MAG TPA: hypothetical protein DEQ40_19115, partial [Oxalobacteraceae bacterium]|nr:hypothetical protein [Oxalobacteraceae bacterium]
MAANEDTAVDAGKLDYAALRSMLEGGSAVDTPEIVPDTTVDAVASPTTETPAAEEAKTEPAPEPAEAQENKEPERDEQGKFKAKESAENKDPIGVQKRIDKAVKAQREAERRASDAEARLAQSQGSRPAEQNAQPPTADQQEPKLETFSDWDAYQAARIKFLTEREFAAANARQQQVAQQQRQQAESETFQKHWSEQETTARAAKPDFDEVVSAMQW